MMSPRFSLVGSLLLCACTPMAAGGGEGSTAAREPSRGASENAPPDAALQYFVGSWDVRAEEPGTGRAFTMVYVVEPVLGGVWLAGRGAAPELGIEARDTWGLDPITGDVVRVVFQNDGTVGTVRSAGWEGDVLRLEGEARTAKGVIRVRETITRLGPDEFSAVWEALRDGMWTAYSVERVTRVPRGTAVPS